MCCCRATENPSESGGTFDSTGAFHGSDDESQDKSERPRIQSFKESMLQKSASQHTISSPKKPAPLSTSQSAVNLTKKLEEEPRVEKKEEVKPPPVEEKREVKQEKEIKKEIIIEKEVPQKVENRIETIHQVNKNDTHLEKAKNSEVESTVQSNNR